MSYRDKIEDALLYLENAQEIRPPSKFYDVSKSHFDGARLFDIDPYGFEFIEPDTSPDVLEGQPINYSFMNSVDDKKDPEHRFTIQKIRAVDAKYVRGRVTRLAKLMIEHTALLVMSNGRAYPTRDFIGYIGGRWVQIACINEMRQHTPIPQNRAANMDDKWDGRIGCMICLQFYSRYEWVANVKIGSGPAIGFVTDPIGAREIFRLRDINPGKLRRAALRNWITEHWRKKRNDPNEATRVREHLRGNTKFNWNGLGVEIKPSRFDIERNDKIRLSRTHGSETGATT